LNSSEITIPISFGTEVVVEADILGKEGIREEAVLGYERPD
jgi:hypothetical protein